MAATSADKIVINDEVLDAQSRELRQMADSFGACTTVQAELDSTAFGVMNAFLVGPINTLADKTSALMSQAAQMTARMSEGTAAASKSFAEHEEEWSKRLSGYTLGAGL